MKVSTTFAPQRSTFSPVQSVPRGVSNLSSIQGRTRREQNIFVLFWDKLKQLFFWIQSFFVTKEKEVEQRFHKVDINGKSIRYQIKGTENEIKMGGRCVRLDDFIFPDKEEIKNLEEMLGHIIEQEKIDVIETRNLFHAWLLWNAGLKTKGDIPFQPESKAKLHDLIRNVLRKPKNKNLAHKVEASLVYSILEGAIARDKHPNKPLVDSRIWDALDEASTRGDKSSDIQKMVENAVEDPLDIDKAREQLTVLEHALKYKIDLAKVERNVPENSKHHVRRLADTDCDRPADANIGEFLIPIRYLFPLIKDSKKEIMRTMVCGLPLIQFSKG